MSNIVAAVEGIQLGRVLNNGMQSQIQTGISLPGWLVLDHIHQKNGEVSQSEIVKFFKTKANTTEVISTLCTKGLAYRVVEPADRREKRVGITDLGDTIREQTAPQLHEAAATLLGNLRDHDVKKLRDISAQVLEHEGVRIWTPSA